MNIFQLTNLTDIFREPRQEIMFHITLVACIIGTISIIWAIIAIHKESLSRVLAIGTFYYSLTLVPLAETIFNSYGDVSGSLAMITLSIIVIPFATIFSIRLIDLLENKINSLLYKRRVRRGENIY